MNISEARRSVGEDIDALLLRSPRVILGVTGPPGAGKSYFATALVADLGKDLAAYVPMDGFHLSNAQLDRLGRRDRKGAVDTFDAAGYVATLDRVARGYGVADVYVPDFDRRLEEPVAAGGVVPAEARVVVTEGNYLGLTADGWSPVRGLLQRLYYVDCPPALRRERLVQRHMAGGRSLPAAQSWVADVDEPNALLIATTRGVCDRVFALG
ncbi:nucleoside/nucleotide kinase family protein [soil metagenome]